MDRKQLRAYLRNQAQTVEFVIVSLDVGGGADPSACVVYHVHRHGGLVALAEVALEYPLGTDRLTVLDHIRQQLPMWTRNRTTIFAIDASNDTGLLPLVARFHPAERIIAYSISGGESDGQASTKFEPLRDIDRAGA